MEWYEDRFKPISISAFNLLFTLISAYFGFFEGNTLASSRNVCVLNNAYLIESINISSALTDGSVLDGGSYYTYSYKFAKSNNSEQQALDFEEYAK